MSASTAEYKFQRPQDRRERLRRLSDRELRERVAELIALIREKGVCAEIGCEERAWPGSDYCLWHPTLQLAGQRPANRTRHSIQEACTCGTS